MTAEIALAALVFGAFSINMFSLYRLERTIRMATTVAQLSADIAAQTTEVATLTALAPQVVAAFSPVDVTTEDQSVVSNTAAVAAAIALLQPLVPAPAASAPATPPAA